MFIGKKDVTENFIQQMIIPIKPCIFFTEKLALTPND